jgi:hypothetical protein
MKQKTFDNTGPEIGNPSTSGDGLVQDLAAKAAALAPALATEETGDPRRRGEIQTVRISSTRYFLVIDNELWAELDWSTERTAWCIQDACGHCLYHIEHMHATTPNKGSDTINPELAIEKAKQMIRDGSMPSPEDARATFKRNRGKEYPYARTYP